MNPEKLYTLALKFKRHDVFFEYEETNENITIGKVLGGKVKLLKGIGIVILTVLLILVIIQMDLPFERLLRFAVLFLAGYALVEFVNYIRLSSANKYKKMITPSEIIIGTDKGDKTYPREAISRLQYHVNKEKDGAGEGSLFLETHKGEKANIITLRDKSSTLLSKDLAYLKSFLEEHLNVHAPAKDLSDDITTQPAT